MHNSSLKKNLQTFERFQQTKTLTVLLLHLNTWLLVKKSNHHQSHKNQTLQTSEMPKSGILVHSCVHSYLSLLGTSDRMQVFNSVLFSAQGLFSSSQYLKWHSARLASSQWSVSPSSFYLVYTRLSKQKSKDKVRTPEFKTRSVSTNPKSRDLDMVLSWQLGPLLCSVQLGLWPESFLPWRHQVSHLE